MQACKALQHRHRHRSASAAHVYSTLLYHIPFPSTHFIFGEKFLSAIPVGNMAPALNPRNDINKLHPQEASSLFYHTSCHSERSSSLPSSSRSHLKFCHLLIPHSNMSSFSTSRIGLHLTPATATWAAPFAAYYLFLQNRIVYHRLKNEQYVIFAEQLHIFPFRG